MSGPNKQKTIVIDVGHGIVPYTSKNYNGWQHGAVVNTQENGQDCYIPEYEINQRNAEMLRKELEERGYKVILTTDERTESPAKGQNFTSRVAIAHKHHADLYISMHANTCNDEEKSGPIVFVLDVHKKTSMAVANKVKGEFNEGFADAFKQVHTLEKDRRGPLMGLKNIPGILIETGFMSNKDNLVCLLDEGHCANLASAIADGIDKFYGKIPASLQAHAKAAVKMPELTENVTLPADSLMQSKIVLKR